MIQQAMQQPDYTPERLRKLMLRLASLEPGQAYTVTLIIPDDGAVAHVITPLGKVENGHRQAQKNMLR
jgi:hypothetical protein